MGVVKVVRTGEKCQMGVVQVVVRREMSDGCSASGGQDGSRIFKEFMGKSCT